MLRKIFILTILLLIIFTTFIKNHTKKLDEKIFKVKENINYLNNVKELVQLEHDYLTSPTKLIEFKNLFFQEDLKHTSRDKIIIITDTKQIDFNNLNINE